MQGQKIEIQERPRWVFWLVLLGLLAAVIFSIAGGILLGSADLNVSTVIDVIKLKLFGIENEELKRSAISIVWELRLPRVLLALAAGGGLAVAGAAMQSVTQNVMADPYILGASSGASAAVGLAFVIGGSFSTSTTAISAFAFGGSMLSLLLVYSVGMIGNTGSGNRLVRWLQADLANCALKSTGRREKNATALSQNIGNCVRHCSKSLRNPILTSEFAMFGTRMTF